MNSDPRSIHYACIANRTTVLAEFNSKGAGLRATAAKCLEKTPPFHAYFTHTVRSKTYTFLIDDPFVYFLISDEKLKKSEGLGFLQSVRDAFVEEFMGEKKLEKLTPHCFQAEFYPFFRRLMRAAADGGPRAGEKNRLVDGEVIGGRNVDESRAVGKGKRVWKKQVWVIVWLDLVLCLILFVVWVWICSGLKCMER